ncbi:hypothetical protein Tsubulata_039813 [Turnera subulata]|uniref:Uncharacterized protein n=1 Tax=Turnera subulata TaxID=218843 RepID=A0A9Q0IZX1_9ROSI|nr:hypothetical protein Tsubulata_039813 [Turnera subulata]
MARANSNMFSSCLASPSVKQLSMSSRICSPSCKFQVLPLPQPMQNLTSTDFLFKSKNLLTTLPCNRTKSLEELVESTQKRLTKSMDPGPCLKLTDTIQRLGISHHFEDEIDAHLERLSDWNAGDNLFATALQFRLLRHNGKPADSDVFSKFMTSDGKLKESVGEDIWGMLSLYEASYLATQSEEKLLQSATDLRTHLQQLMPLMKSKSSRQVAQALKHPRHLRMASLEARNYIDEYSGEEEFSPDIWQLAELDFNMVQQLHQRELAEISSWWKQLGLVEKLSFARDQVQECFLWAVGMFPEPYHSSCRIELTKTVAILLVLDDVFDSYGSLDELILFTNAIERWELSAMEQLPEYMKICYMELYNNTNDIAFRVLKEHGWSIVSYLQRTWVDIIQGFLVEAKWYNRGYVPSLDEYLSTSITTSGSYMAQVYASFLMGQGVTKDTAAVLMDPNPSLFSISGKILRLWDDLGTAKEEQERGDVASSIQCLMAEKKLSSEREAREHIRKLINSSWTELNSALVASNSLPLSIKKASLNMGRTAQVVYQHGDDENAPSVNHQVQTLFYNPIM